MTEICTGLINNISSQSYYSAIEMKYEFTNHTSVIIDNEPGNELGNDYLGLQYLA